MSNRDQADGSPAAGTVADSRGTTSCQYTARRHLGRVDHPDGEWLSYTYDGVGNVASITTPGGTTSYKYDSLNRLETVTDKDLGETIYGYDAVGNKQSQLYPNGAVASYDYDALHRLTYILSDHRKSGHT